MKRLILFFKECVAEPLFHLLFVVVIVIAIWFSLGFLTVEKTTLSYLHNTFVNKLPPKTIRIMPRPVKTPSLFGIQLKRPRGSFIDDGIIKKIYRLKGVAKVYPFLSAQIPMQVQISLFGIGYQSDVVAIGVPWEFIQSEVPSEYRKKWRNWKEGNVVIGLLPATILDMYNQTLAKPNQLPIITEEFAKGQKLRLIFGKSSLKTVGTPLAVDGELAGFSRKIGEIALILPLAVVTYYNQFFGYTNAEYSYVLVEAEDHESVLSLTKEIQKLGLLVISEKNVSEEIISLQKNIQFVFSLLQVLIWGLCGSSIGLAAFLAGLRRQKYHHLLRILGMSRTFLLAMTLAKYVLLAGGAFFLSTFSFQIVAQNLSLPLSGLSLEIAKNPDMRFFSLAIGTALLPSIVLLSARPGSEI